MVRFLGPWGQAVGLRWGLFECGRCASGGSVLPNVEPGNYGQENVPI